MDKNSLKKVYRTVQELWIQVFTKQSSGKFTEIFRTNYRTFDNFLKMYRILYLKVL